MVQKYNYDPIDRLVAMSSLEKSGNTENLVGQSSWSYDAIGNMLYSNENFEKIYSYSTDKPQQAVQIGNEPITYDTLGNIVKTGNYEISWTSFSKPSSIKTSKNVISFEYGPNRERITKSFNTGKALIHYVEDFYEKWFIIENNTISISEKFFVKALNKIIAKRVVTKAQDKLFYLNQDAFGSIESINDDAGRLLLKYKYSPFGYRDISYTNTSSDLLPYLNIGFSSKDIIDDDRLLYFQGRIYDSVFSRFLSPDPYIQEPYNIKNLNRYSYCLNNPFKYSDPSGYWFWEIFVVIIKVVVKSIIDIIIPQPDEYPYVPIITGRSDPTTIVTNPTSPVQPGSTSAPSNTNPGMPPGTSVSVSGNIKALPSLISNPIGAESSRSNRNFNRNEFFDGFDFGLLTTTSVSQAYKRIIGYGPNFDNGRARSKGREMRASNFKCIPSNGPSLFGDRTPLSNVVNKIGGISSLSGLNDIFQVSLCDKFYIRDIVNVPAVPVAASLDKKE